MSRISFNEMQRMVYDEYIKNGYLDMWYIHGMPTAEIREKMQAIADIGEVGLFTSEVGEALEAIRHGDSKEHLAEELADIVIRVMNFATRKDIDLENAILLKHEKNMKRPILHGKKV